MQSASPTDLDSVVRACRAVLADAGTVEVAAEYLYASLPLCVIGSVFSIGVRCEGARNVLDRRYYPVIATVRGRHALTHLQGRRVQPT